MIENPTPLTTGTFAGMWLTRLAIGAPQETVKGYLGADFLPTDGQHLLATGGKQHNISDLKTESAKNPGLKTLLSNLCTEVARLSDLKSEIKYITVLAPDPQRTVTAQIVFTNGQVYRVRDCYDLASKDPVFAEVFIATLTGIAALAGLNSSYKK